jgi:hypothetical protein
MRLLWLRPHAIIAVLITISLTPVTGIEPPQAQQPPNTPRNLPEFLNRLPDANDQARMRQDQSGQPNFEAANALRKKEVTEDSAKLVKLANDLKAELDSAGKDTLSVSAIKKAEAIEKLAKSLKQKMTTATTPQRPN